MAIIGKIRQRSGLIITLIGLAMAAFVATDLMSNRLFSKERGPKGIGRIYGEYVQPNAPDGYVERLQKALQNQRQSLKANESLSPSTENQISDQIWNEYVQESLLKRECEKLGIDVSGQEIIDLCVGPNPHPLAVQYLSDPKTHAINRPQLLNFIQKIEENPRPEAKEFWRDFETYLYNQRLKEKYIGLVKNGIFSTDLEAKADFINHNKMAAIQFVPLFLNSISDSAVQVSDADVKDYYNKHQDEMKRTQGRAFEFVTFDIRPTSEDTASALKWINMQKTAFQNTKDDSNFVTRVGRGTFSNTYEPHGSSDIPKDYEDQVFSADSGTMIGPFYEDGKYKLIKVLGHKNDSVYYYKASHILIRPNGMTQKDSDEAYNKAKTIYAKAKSGEDFAKLARENSQDQSNAGKGGDLGWFADGQMVKKFNDAVKNGHKGDILLVKTEFGTHVIKVTENKSNRKVKVAVLEKAVVAGAETEKLAYDKVRNFAGMATNADEFDAAAKKLNLTKHVAENVGPNQHDITGLDNPKDLIRWAYDADTKVGSISDPKRIGDKYVVAKITRSYEEGIAPFEDVKDNLKPLAVHEKKKQMLADKLKAAYEKNKSLDAIAKEVKSSVSTADNIIFDMPTIPNLGHEPAVTGTIFGLKQGQTSNVIEGENGAYIVKLTSVNKIDPPAKFDTERKQLTQQEQGNVENPVFNALKEQADVKDYRYQYSY